MVRDRNDWKVGIELKIVRRTTAMGDEQMNKTAGLDRRAIVAGAGLAIASSFIPARAAGRTAPEFVGLDGWLNSGPLTLRGLRGRPVLVNFFARSCINCIHAMPHLESWYERYSHRGFVLVGVHTPEFPVEKSRPALAAAIERYGLTYPIAEDNESATWNAWRNVYWPAEYVIDQSGRIVHEHVGEGGYGETESLIQSLLA